MLRHGSPSPAEARHRSRPLVRSRTAGPATGRRAAPGPPPPPVLCEPVVEELLALGPSGVFADCTFGSGGHARAVLRRLSPRGLLLALDVDPAAIMEARALAAADCRLRVHHLAYSELARAVPPGRRLSGVLLDLGPNEASERDPRRGLALGEDLRCDLRMNPGLGVGACEWLRQISSEELAWVIREYGDDEDPLVAARVAEALVQQSKRGPFRTAREIADVIALVKNNTDSKARYPAKGTFQAIRTFLNREPHELQAGLLAAFDLLEMGGRCVVICRYRWEMVAVRRFLRDHEDYEHRQVHGWSRERLTHLYPLLMTDRPWAVNEFCCPITPTPQEGDLNKKARSARAFVFEKVPRKSCPSPVEWLPKNMQAMESFIFARPAKLPTFAGACEGISPESINGCRAPSVGNNAAGMNGSGSYACASGVVLDGRPLAEAGLHRWLHDVGAGTDHLLCYQEAIQRHYQSPEEILLSIGACNGKSLQVDVFFKNAGVERMGHRRLFQKWFTEHPPVTRHDAGNEGVDAELDFFRDVQLENARLDQARGGPPPRHDENSLAGDEAELFLADETMGSIVSWCHDIPAERSGTSVDRVAELALFEDMFEQFHISSWLHGNLARCRYTRLTQVQRHAIPFGLIGRDVVISAPAGSGKSLAYLIPLVVSLPEGLASASYTGAPQGAAKPLGLVMVPTRELCVQIHLEARRLCHGSPFRTSGLFGGGDFREQVSGLARGVDLCVATPERFIELVDRRIVSLEMIGFIALDEVAAMLDMGLETRIRRLVTMRGMPNNQSRQSMLCSAAFPPPVQALANSLLYDYVWINVDGGGAAAGGVDQELCWVSSDEKPSALLEIMSQKVDGKTIIFVGRGKDSSEVLELLSFVGQDASCLHDDMLRREREVVLQRFREDRQDAILIAAGVAGRDLDVAHVQRVLNYDLPATLEEYTHRIGRIGLPGRRGAAVSLFVSRGGAGAGGDDLAIARRGLFALLRRSGAAAGIPAGLEAEVSQQLAEREQGRGAAGCAT